MTTFYIQKFKNDGSKERLIYTIQEMGYELFVEEYIPFVENNLSFLPIDKPVVFHGGIDCALNVRYRKLPFRPFAWFDPDVLKCSHYYSHWNPYLTQQVYGFYPLGTLKDKKEWIYDVYGEEDRIFIRPDSNDKLFVGQVVAKDRLEGFLNFIWVTEDMGTTLALVSRPEALLSEYRLIMHGGKVVTGSRYMDRGVLDTEAGFPDQVAQFAELVCKTWTPHPIFVLDLATTENGVKVVECGSINCAGYYAADLRKIVKAMADQSDVDFSEKT